jgi:hypothetical protein
MLLEELDQLGEAGQGTRKAIDLIGTDDVDLPGSNVSKKAREGRAVQAATREAAIIIVVTDQRPALVYLAFHIRGASFPLGVE